MTNPIGGTPVSAWRPIVEEDLSYRIVGCFFRVYNALGYGFLESLYSKAMVIALRQAGLRVECEVPVSVFFDGIEVGKHRIDLLVEGRAILENKSTEKLSDIPKRQLRSYLTAAHLELGIILHFGPRPAYYRVLHKPKAEPSKNDSAHSGNSDE